VELERTRNDLAALGLGLCSVSYDSVEILQAFAARRGITFPMLADPDSAIICRFGLLNEDARPGTREDGMCHPGIFLVDASGVVRERFVEPRFYHRVTMPSVLWRLGAATATEHSIVFREHVEVRASAPQTALHPGNRVTLLVDVRPRPGAHVYGPDVGGGYQGLAVRIDPQPWLTVHAAQYPAARMLTLPWTDEILTGYTAPVRIEIDVALGTRQELAGLLEAGQGLTLTGTCLLQACDDQVCWPPESIGIEWRFDLIPPDLARAPEELQHRAEG
jgi:hypothetical protein